MPVFDGRRLSGGLPVDENARRLSNCFHAERQLLHCLCGALPRVASFELKILLGTQIWSIGQSLSGYSRRLSELRTYGDYPARPGEAFESVLNEMDRAPSTGAQLSWIYRRFVPALCRTYESYIAECDPLLDEPTVQLLSAAVTAHQEY